MGTGHPGRAAISGAHPPTFGDALPGQPASGQRPAPPGRRMRPGGGWRQRRSRSLRSWATSACCVLSMALASSLACGFTPLACSVRAISIAPS